MGVTVCLLVTYFIQRGVYFFWTRIAFPRTFASGVNDYYFVYLNIMEFLFFIFIRTRLSLKYTAKMLSISNVVFLLYLNSYMYSCQYQMLNLNSAISLMVFSLFMHIAEVPAMRDWNPFDENT